jgi:hypothetical protein
MKKTLAILVSVVVAVGLGSAVVARAATVGPHILKSPQIYPTFVPSLKQPTVIGPQPTLTTVTTARFNDRGTVSRLRLVPTPLSDARPLVG